MSKVVDTNLRAFDEIRMNEVKHPEVSSQSLLKDMKPTESCNCDDEDQVDSSCPDLISDLDHIIRSFGKRTSKRSSALNRLCQKTVMSYEDHEDHDGMSSGTSSYNSGFSSSSDSTFSSDSAPSAKLVGGLTPEISKLQTFDAAVNVDISTKEAENLISVSKLNKRKATGSTERAPNLPGRSKRLGKSSPANVDSLPVKVADQTIQCDVPSSSIKRKMRGTRKSISQLLTRKKTMDQVAGVSSDFLKVDAPKSDVLVEPLRISTEEEHNPTSSLETSIGPTFSAGENALNFRQGELANRTPHKLEVNLHQRGKVPREARKGFTSPSLVNDRADQFIERFDCDTGEIVAEGGLKSLLKPIIRGFECDSGDRVTEQELFAAQILSQDLRNSSPSKVADPALPLNTMKPIDVTRGPPSPTSVIENMELIFSEADVKGIKNLLRDSVDSSISSISTNSSCSLSRSSPDEGEHSLLSDKSDSSTGSASLSDRHKARHLRSTKVLVRKSNNTASRSLISSSFSVTYTLPLNSRGVVLHHAISILLVKPAQKVFEIVSVDVTRSTLLKDTIYAACLAASNPVLAQQTYISLCGDGKVLSNMTSPMSKLMFVPKPSRGLENLGTNQSPEEQDNHLRRDMERRLLVAVPEKSDATECQTIRRLLWKNPKLQVWWNMQEMNDDDFLF